VAREKRWTYPNSDSAIREPGPGRECHFVGSGGLLDATSEYVFQHVMVLLAEIIRRRSNGCVKVKSPWDLLQPQAALRRKAPPL